jgi:hypothetical protein
MKAFVLSCLVLAGCSSTSRIDDNLNFVAIYSHPEYGQVLTDDPRYVADSNKCKEEAYKDGVEVNGVLITDQQELIKIESDYRYGYVKSTISDVRAMPSQGKINEIASEYAENEPAHIRAIRKKGNRFNSCIRVDKKYELLKTDVYDKQSGLLLETIMAK